MRAERWLPIPGFDGYEVSDLGRVRSWLVPGSPSARRVTPRILKTYIDRGGYVKVGICRDRKRHPRTVHSLVMEAFVGERPPGMEVAHGNGVRADNALGNLRYATPAENWSDRYNHGTSIRGERGPKCRLSEVQVREIRVRLAAGESRRDLSAAFGVSHSAIKHIDNRTSWGWLE